MTHRQAWDDNSVMSRSTDPLQNTPDASLSLPLPDWGVIAAQGDDAAAFLHGQLTQDVLLLPEGQAHLAGYCSAKGRLLATLVVLKVSASLVLLLTPKASLAPMLKRLSMFVLRAKVKLSDASDAWRVLGQMRPLSSPAAAAAPAPWQVKPVLGGAAQGHEIALYPAPNASRSLLLLPADAVNPPKAPPPRPLSQAAWDEAEVLAGVAFLRGELLDTFVPQMLNYESIGGVSFKKGCYPGQEVVARSQFRGSLKRRLFLAQATEVDLPVGTEVFTSSDANDQPSGVVVQCAPHATGGACLLLVLHTEAVREHPDDLHARHPQGPRLDLMPLPYELLADV